jgi:hypothetical protein
MRGYEAGASMSPRYTAVEWTRFKQPVMGPANGRRGHLNFKISNIINSLKTKIIP